VRIHKGDLKPALVIACTSTDPFNLNDATSVIIRATQGITVTNLSCVVSGDGQSVSHQWVAGETDVPGQIYARVIPTWGGGRPQAFPNLGSALVHIDP
jgi:hypothetical protein